MYSYFKIYFYMSNFASIGRFDLVHTAITWLKIMGVSVSPWLPLDDDHRNFED